MVIKRNCSEREKKLFRQKKSCSSREKKLLRQKKENWNLVHAD